MKMIKKLISISVILTMALAIGAVVDVEKIDAAGTDVTYDADTVVDITGTTAPDLKIKSGSTAESVAVNISDVTVGLASGSDITFESASGLIMSVSGCTATYATFTAGVPSTMRIQYDSTCTSAVLTIGTGTLTEVNVAANPLTAATASVYTVTFRTVNPLIATQKIKLVFGGGFTIADSGGSAVVTDDGATVTPTLTTSSASKEVILTLASDVTASSVIVIDLTSVVTNPATTSLTHTAGAPDLTVLGIDLYTTTSGNTTIDSLADQTPYNRIIELEPGWNIFAPSQKLETPDAIGTTASVLTPITDDYSTVYTLTRADAGVMEWTTPDTIDPLYGYAIYITAGSTVKLPLDFAKETINNGVESRSLAYKGWHIVGYMGDDDGTTDYLNAQLQVLIDLKVAGNEEFSQIVDFTGKAPGTTAPGDHTFGGSSSPVGTMVTERANETETMRFHIDFGYAIVTTADGLLLNGNRDDKSND